MITHAARATCPILDRAIGARPSALFDVQLAAGFVGLGLPSLGTLVSVLLGIRLDKSEQLADWSKRPLSDATRLYAAADVEYLFPLTVELQHRLQDMGGRRGRRASASVLRTTADRRVDPASRGGRSRARRRCAARRRRVAQSVAGWRERRAQRLDVLPRVRAARPRARRGRRPSAEDARPAVRVARRQPVAQRRGARAARRGRSRTRLPKDRLRLPEKYDDGPELDAAVALLVAYVAELRARASASRSSCWRRATT